jgi:hypothetical protein
MNRQINCRNATKLGPFLTLLVLSASRQTRDAASPVQDRTLTSEQCAEDQFATLSPSSDWNTDSATIDPTPSSLGPFLTLIVTLRCRNAPRQRPVQHSTVSEDVLTR